MAAIAAPYSRIPDQARESNRRIRGRAMAKRRRAASHSRSPLVPRVPAAANTPLASTEDIWMLIEPMRTKAAPVRARERGERLWNTITSSGQTERPVVDGEVRRQAAAQKRIRRIRDACQRRADGPRRAEQPRLLIGSIK